MVSTDFEVIKEIPGYKVILKAVLKSQIQQLVDQLAAHTEEESIILTASVADGTLSHLGSDSGKSFLDDHEVVKSQFLSFCLKAHHRKAQQGKFEKQEAMLASPFMYSGPSPRFPYTAKPPRFMSPRQGSMTMTRGPYRSQMRSFGIRQEPYPAVRTQKRASGFEQRGPGYRKRDGQIVKIEPNSDDEASNQSDSNISAHNICSSSQPSSPSETPAATSQAKNELLTQDDFAQLECSVSTIPSEIHPEGLSLDSDLSHLITGAQCSGDVLQTSSACDVDPNLNIKLESVLESKMDLNITGVEHSNDMVAYADWAPVVSMGMNLNSSGVMNYDPSYTAVDQPDKQTSPQQGYNIKYKDCIFCGKIFPNRAKLDRHIRIHTGDKPFTCSVCGRSFNQKTTMDRHLNLVHKL